MFIFVLFDSVPDSVVAFSDHRPEKIKDPFLTLSETYIPVTVESRGSPFRYFVSIIRGVQTVLRADPEILVTDHTGPLSFVAAILSIVFGRPLVVRTGGNPVEAKRRRIAETRENNRYGRWLIHKLHELNIWFVLRVADGYIAVSDSHKQELVAETSVSPERVRVVPVPIRTWEFNESDPYPLDTSLTVEDATILLTVTNLGFEGKCAGVRDLGSGVLATLAANDDLVWIIAGDGKYRDSLQSQIETLAEQQSVNDRVHFVGFVSDIASLYALADVFIYASEVDGYPNVILEAQASKLPVVANPEHGIVEQIKDDVSGVFVNPTDPEDVMAAIQRLLDNPNYRRDIAIGGYKRVCKENTPEVVAQQMLQELGVILYLERQ